MRLIGLSIIALVCVGTVFLFRNSLRAHAEKYSGAIEELRSNKEAKGDRLDLLYRPSKTQSLAPVQSLSAPQAPARPELSKPVETVSWHWREGRTITKTSSSGEKRSFRVSKFAR
jgi:hypothetical protein